MAEIWKPCVGYEGYEVSNLGNVRSPNCLLAPAIGSHGYPQVQLGRKKTRTIHSLVLESFVGPCPPGKESCHGDGNKLNCTLKNLRWDTPKKNGEDKMLHGTAKSGAQKAVATRKGNIIMAGYHSIDAMCRAGCTSRRGIRHWEDKGLFGPVERTAGDTRRYTDEQVDKARIIAAAAFGGWSLEEINQMLIEWGPEVHEAILTRLADQAMAAARLGESLPNPPGMSTAVKYDL